MKLDKSEWELIERKDATCPICGYYVYHNEIVDGKYTCGACDFSFEKDFKEGGDK